MLKDIMSGMSGILNKEAKDMISVFAMILIPMGLLWSIIFLPQLLMKEINKPEKCWEVQALDNKAYKINTCTGETVLIESSSTKNEIENKKETTNKALQPTPKSGAAEL